MFGVYIHIPFCVRKCLYCDFLSFHADEATKNRYVAALLTEIKEESVKYKKNIIDTVFIGGGTPSILQAADIERILDTLRQCFEFARKPEITIEVNPESVNADKLKTYKRAGINRISIGTQSVQDEELKILGRMHSSREFFQTFYDARNAGFDNINVDLMSALPGQTIETYRDTLHKILALKPEHISAYSLIIEEGTPYYDTYGENPSVENPVLPLPAEDEERAMYQITEEILGGSGYERYEISNYSLKGYECRHNCTYWKRYDYVGFGLGAASMVNNVRWKNRIRLEEYSGYYCGVDRTVDGVKEQIQSLSVSEQMEEFMFLGLRLTEGVSRIGFRKTFAADVEEIYGEVIQKLKVQKLIETGEQIKLTPYGRDVSNYAMSQFIF